MTTTSFVARLRRLFSPNKSVKRESVRHLRLMQLEDRRVLNATFALVGAAGAADLTLDGFDDVGGTEQLDISFDVGADEFVFTLQDAADADAGVWSGVSDGGATGVGTSELRVDRSVFENPGDMLDWRILDNAVVNDIDLDVVVSTSATLPDSPTDGSFLINVDGDVDINASVDTAGSDFTVMAGGTISGAGLVTAATVDLDAATGITANLAATTITADNSTSGAVDIDNAQAGAVTVTTLTTAGGGTILFENTGAGGVSFGTVSTTTDGTAAIGEDDITLSSDGGDLTITTSVTADGMGDITLNTTTSGNVILTGTTTAAGDQVTVNSIGAINGAGLVTASVVDLNAATGIGNTTPLELAAATITADNSTSGAVDIDNAQAGAVTVTTLTTAGGGTILFENTGAGGVSFGTVSTTTDGTAAIGEDDITLSSDGGDLTITTSVTADGMGDITLNTTTSGNVILTGTTTAAGDQVTVNSIGAINGAGLVTASVVDLNAATGIGNTTPLELAAATITADNSTSGAVDIDNAQAGAVTVTTLTTAGGGTILFENTGAGGVSFGTVSTTTDGTAAIGEDDITLSSDGGDLTITTSVTADGMGDITLNTTTSGNVILTGTTTAAGDQVTVNSIGAINGAGLVTASVVDLNAATGIGNTTPLELAAATITADNSTSGAVDIDNAQAGAVTVTTLTTAGGGTILFENTGAGGVSFGTVSTTTDGTAAIGEDDITLSSDGGDLTITTSVTADGMGDITLNTTTSGNVILTGTTTAAGDQVTVNSIGAINGAGLVTASVVDLNAATGIGNTTPLELAAATITADNSTSGNVNIDNALVGAVTVTTLRTAGGGTILFENTGAGGVSFGTVSTTTDGTPAIGEDDITLSSDGGDLTITTSVTADGMGDITLNTTTSGNVILTGTTTAAGDQVTVNSIGAINGAGLVTASVVDLNAATGIGNTTPLELAAATITADNSTSGAVDIDNAQAGAVTVTTLTTAGGGTILFENTGAGGVSFGTVSTTTDGTAAIGEDDITLSSDGGDLTITTSVTADGMGDITLNTTTSGNVILTGTTTAAGDQVTVNSIGAINGAGLVTASVVDLNAATGIGNTTPLELAAATITADNSTSGAVDIDNAQAGAVTVTTLTTAGGGTILFENTGAGGVSFGTVSTTTDGTAAIGEDDITLSSDGGDLTITTSVTADGMGDITLNTTTSGNVILTGTTTAAGDQVTVNSIGAINGAGLVTASVVDLNAATGIGNTTPLELAAATITADNSTSGNVNIDNALVGAVTVTTLRTAGGGTILFENTGAGGVSFGTVSTTTDGTPAIGEDDITLSSDGGDLTITTSVTADGMGDITLNTTTSGNVILTGTTTAAGDQVTVNSIGAINGAGLVTASVVDLNAATGIGNTTPLELAAATITADNSTSGNVNIDNALVGAVTVTTLRTAGGGTILFENTGAGGVSFGTVSTTTDGTPAIGEDDITLSSDGGDLTITTSVTADGMGDITLNTTTSGNVILTGTTTAAGDQVTVTSVGNITSSAAGTITTTGDKSDEDSGNVTIDAGNDVNLSGAVVTNGFTNNTSAADSDAGNVSIRGGGNVEVDTISAIGGTTNDATIMGEGGIITLNAAGGNVTTDGTIDTSTEQNLTFDPAAAVSLATENITWSDHGLKTGDEIVYDNGSAASTDIAPLVSGQRYFAIVVDANTIQLASTSANAFAATAINLTAAGTGTAHTLDALATRLDIDATGDVIVNQTITTRGGSVDVDAGGSVTTAAAGDITTSNDKLDENAGHVSIDAGTTVILNGDVISSGVDNATDARDSDGGEIRVTTVNGSITTSGAINAVGGATTDATIMGEGGVVSLDANGAAADVTTNGTINTSTELPDLTSNPATVTDLVAETITWTNHGLQTGDLVTYSACGGTDITGLTSGTTYHVISASEDSIQLAANLTNALAGTAIDLTAVGTGQTHTLDVVKVRLDAGRDVAINNDITTRGGTVDVDAVNDVTSGANDDITTTGDKINEDSGHVYIDAGNDVNLSGAVVTSGFTNATTTEDSEAGNVTIRGGGNVEVDTINATGGSTTDATVMGEGGKVTLNAAGGNVTTNGTIDTSTEQNLTFDPATAVNLATENITWTEHGLKTGDEIVYDNGSAASTDIGGLASGQRYFAIVVDANTIQLATTSANAFAATAINLTAAGTGTAHTLDALATRLDIDATGNVNINQTVTTRGGSVDVDAGGSVTTAAAGDITTSNDKLDENAGHVSIDAATTVTLNGDVISSGVDNATDARDSDGGNVTVNGGQNITVQDIDTSGGAVASGVGGNAGTIALDAGTAIPGIITLNGDVTAAGGKGDTRGDGSNFIINDPTLIGVDDDPAATPPDLSVTRDIVINTSGNTSGNVRFTESVDGVTAFNNDLTIITGTTTAPATTTFGDVDFNMNVGGNTALGDISVDTAKDVNFSGTVNAKSLTQLSGTGTTTLANDVIADPGAPTTVHTFNGSTAVTAGTDEITITGHGLTTGDSIVYDNGAGGTVGGTNLSPVVTTIPGLEPGKTYVVIRVDGNTIQLAENHENAEAGTAIDLTGTGLGQDHSIAKVSVSINTADAIDVNGNITAEDGMIDGTAATGEQIVLSAATIDVAAMSDITTATAKPAGSATLPVYTATGDKIRIIAGTALVFDNSAELITDGGIANTFEPGLPAAAIAQVLQNQKYDPMDLDALLSTWNFNVGATGEVNLQVNIDWRDPVNDMAPVDAAISYNTETSSRYETFAVGTGGNFITVGHVYSSLNDFIPFALDNQLKFCVDFSVSHHDSIRVVAPNTLDNVSNTPTQNSTDDPETGSFNPLAAANIAPDSGNFTGVGSLDLVVDNQDLHFEDGLLEVVVRARPLFIPDPVADPPERLVPAVAEPLVPVPDPVLVTPAEPVEFPTTSLSTQSEDFFQLRQKGSNEPVPGYDHIDDELGWKILQPKRLRKWVQQEGLNGSDYELWVITTKVKDDGTVRFERPVLRFDVFDNQPFPMEESIPELLPELRLERLDVDENGNLLDSAPDEGPDTIQVPDDADDVRVNSDDDQVEALVIPGSEATSQMGGVSGTAAQSAMAGLAVSQLLGRKRRTEAVSSPHTSMISRILNRGTELK